MALKYHKPTTPSKRGQISLDRSSIKIPLERKKELKSVLKFLREGRKETGGRNHQGKITAFHRGGGHKRRNYKVLHRRNLLSELLDRSFPDTPFLAKVEEFIYDPNRSSSLALLSIALTGKNFNERCISKKSGAFGVYYDFSRKSLWFLILNTKDLLKGDYITISKKRASIFDPQKPAEALPVQEAPLGSIVHNLEIHKGKGGQVARAAGTYGQVIENLESSSKVRIRLPSGKERWFYYDSYLSLGSVADEDWKHLSLSKAGRKRWLGRRPIVRGVAINPVDHPHGGGTGKTSGGRPSVTPWGRLTHNWSSSSKKRKKNPFHA